MRITMLQDNSLTVIDVVDIRLLVRRDNYKKLETLGKVVKILKIR